MIEKEFSTGSARRLAKLLVDVKEDKRKNALKQLPSDMKCKVVEEMVNIRLERLRSSDGTIRPAKVSER